MLPKSSQSALGLGGDEKKSHSMSAIGEKQVASTKQRHQLPQAEAGEETQHGRHHHHPTQNNTDSSGNEYRLDESNNTTNTTVESHKQQPPVFLNMTSTSSGEDSGDRRLVSPPTPSGGFDIGASTGAPLNEPSTGAQVAAMLSPVENKFFNGGQNQHYRAEAVSTKTQKEDSGRGVTTIESITASSVLTRDSYEVSERTRIFAKESEKIASIKPSSGKRFSERR